MPLLKALNSIRLFRGYYTILIRLLSSLILAFISNLTPHSSLVKFLLHSLSSLFSHHPLPPADMSCTFLVDHMFHSNWYAIRLSLCLLKSHLFNSTFNEDFQTALTHRIVPFSLWSQNPNIPLFSLITSYAYYMILAHTFSWVYNLHTNVAYKSPCIDSSVFLLIPYSVLFIA